jgi:hypothetical protein
MLLSDDVLRAIGRVAVLAGRLELDQARLTGALIGPDNEVSEVLARSAENFGRLQDLASRLVVSRYAVHQYREEHRLKALIDEWMRETEKAMDERNEVIHGIWGTGATGEPSYLTNVSHTSARL